MGKRGKLFGLAAAIALASLSTGMATPSNASTDVALHVDANAGRHAISPDIYGMNFPDTELAKELKLPVARFGGNSTTRYNYQSKTTNRANDYYFLNTKTGNDEHTEVPLEDFVTRDKAVGAKSLVTMPIMGWVTDPNKEGACGFSVKKYGKQTDAADDCGNGMKSDDKKLTGNDPHDTSIEVGPDWVTGEVKHLVSTFGAANAGGVGYYSLDNEPSLWDNTHFDLHPKPTTYDELASRGITYAQAIKAGDPGAKVFGPADWGFISYLDSEGDIDGGNTNERDAHGGEELVPWYLDQFRTYEQQHHQRLLDYLDEHFYPETQDNEAIPLTTVGDAKAQQFRFETTRALWDPTYLDESYIGKNMNEHMAIIPRLKRYVAEHYPGTKVALTEYNWGGLEAVNGALAEADVLGIFGAEGLDLATVWSPPKATDRGANAWRMYLDYDGAGGHFGDTSVTATSADREKVAVYAAERASDHALTIVLINKTKDDITTPVSIAGGPAATKADVWRYSGAAPRPIAAGSLPVSSGNIAVTLPGQSMELLVVPGKGIAAAAAATNTTEAAAAPASDSSGTQATTSSPGTRHPNLPLLAIGGILIVAAGVGAALRADVRKPAIAVLVVGALVLGSGFVFRSSGGGSSSANVAGANTATRGGAVTITSPKPGSTLHKSDKFTGTVKLESGQQLFLLVYAAGPQQYYDAAEVPTIDGNGNWSAPQYVTGDKGETYTLYAFVMSADQAASWANADKSNVKTLPDGVTAQTTVDFKL